MLATTSILWLFLVSWFSLSCVSALASSFGGDINYTANHRTLDYNVILTYSKFNWIIGYSGQILIDIMKSIVLSPSLVDSAVIWTEIPPAVFTSFLINFKANSARFPIHKKRLFWIIKNILILADSVSPPMRFPMILAAKLYSMAAGNQYAAMTISATTASAPIFDFITLMIDGNI